MSLHLNTSLNVNTLKKIHSLIKITQTYCKDQSSIVFESYRIIQTPKNNNNNNNNIRDFCCY